MLKFLSVKLIRFYQKYLSKGACPFIPSCSEYTLEAILKHGFFKGVCFGAYRILRCNGFTKGGFDKVPDKKSDLKWIY
ncbi:MAG: membrane protein insertion efficiency factor YidD [Clostridia bacterium]|jgi:putative membrane protein insertion efficiency factor|nr:membrane protein insertion efficiency factor YidD [Clostridia bacterium]